ncbi:MAG: hypothetical protein GQ535_15340 [Rhodobacteraceae bacterium]|nr:hypothetical protein [Paracoccaceae bacterium]
MLRVETHAVSFVILIIAIGTGIFIPYGATDILTRISVIAVAMLTGTSFSALILYLLLPIHLVKNISLWSIAAFHTFLAATVFSLIEPEIIRYLHPYPVPTRLEVFVPFLLLNGLVDVFILWLFKSQICLRTYTKRHKTQSIKALLPAQKYSEIWVISAADHYVEIISEQGRHMHRMTMKSAVAKTDEGEGLRVHRSHWVAHRAMFTLSKEGERYFLTLRNGERLPVSPKMAPEVQAYLDKGQLLAAQ